MERKLTAVIFIVSLGLCVSCSRPVKKPERVFYDNYEKKDTLIITSSMRETEGYIHVLKKPIERTYGLHDTLYLVYKRGELVGFVTADRRAYRYSWRNRPYDIEGQPDIYRHKQHIGAWRTLELNVQKILELPYPVKVY